ncbi:MAG: hypothetical protein AAB610_02365 [Patescibacteria group bacterium]
MKATFLREITAADSNLLSPVGSSHEPLQKGMSVVSALIWLNEKKTANSLSIADTSNHIEGAAIKAEEISAFDQRLGALAEAYIFCVDKAQKDKLVVLEKAILDQIRLVDESEEEFSDWLITLFHSHMRFTEAIRSATGKKLWQIIGYKPAYVQPALPSAAALA